MKTSWTNRSFGVASRHFDNLDRLAPFGTLDRFANNCRIGKSRTLSVSSETTRMEQDIALPVYRINETITARRIIPFHATLETKHFRVVENFMS